MAPASEQREFLVFGSPQIGDVEIAEVVDSLRSGWIGTGPKVRRFERELAEYVGAPHVSCLSSCTAGLAIALELLGVGDGDEVIVPAMTFVATANVVERAGAVPVLVDVRPNDGLIDLAAAEAAITPRTRAMIPVHMAGRPVDLEAVRAIADRHGIAVIEDAAHAIGGEWRGRPIGSHGNLVSYSFYATKNVTTAEGGALACPSAELAERAMRLARHGLSGDVWKQHRATAVVHNEAVEPGLKHNMTDLQAALGIHQLARLDDSIEQRARQWTMYDDALRDLPVEVPPPPAPDTRHARHLYQVLVEPEAPRDRDELAVFLRTHAVGTGIHYRGVHLHRYYRERYGLDPASLPVASDISDRTLSLPFGPAVSDDDVAYVVETMRAGLSG